MHGTNVKILTLYLQHHQKKPPFASASQITKAFAFQELPAQKAVTHIMFLLSVLHVLSIVY